MFQTWRSTSGRGFGPCRTSGAPGQSMAGCTSFCKSASASASTPLAPTRSSERQRDVCVVARRNRPEDTRRIKKEAAAILGAAGLMISDAFRMMIMRTVADKALPFDPPVPNDETIEAMKAARRGDLVTVGSVEDLIADLRQRG